jgi:hypothetical protein
MGGGYKRRVWEEGIRGGYKRRVWEEGIRGGYGRSETVCASPPYASPHL